MQEISGRAEKVWADLGVGLVGEWPDWGTWFVTGV